jgi:predicted O-linked N-acetylglucosamine transferase (SPINDLY family)
MSNPTESNFTLPQALALALQHHQAGRLRDAQTIYQKILAADPNHPDALHLLGLLYSQSGHHPQALELVRRAIQLHPTAPTFHASLANIHHAAGQFHESIASYRRAIELRPDYIEALSNLGGLYFERRLFNDAADCCRAVLKIRPDFVIAWSNLAHILNEQKRFSEALDCADKALSLQPDFPDATAARGNSLRELGRIDESITCFNQVLTLQPNAPKILNNLSISLTARKRFDEALVALDKAIALQPNWPTPWVNRATTLRDAGRPHEAALAAQRAIDIDPNLPEAHINLAGSLLILERIDDALSPARRAVELNSRSPEALATLAWALKDAGDIPASIAALDRALELDPTNPTHRSNKIYTLEFDPRADAKSLLAEQRKWNEIHRVSPSSSTAPLSRAERPLRIAYVSPYFHGHAESFFVLPLLESHDHKNFEIHCYSDSIRTDEITERLKRAANVWHITSALTHNQLAEKIRADRIDILIDLAMHMSHNRLLTLVQKPAPIQIAWLAYPGGTGLDAIDYRITDPHLDLPQSANAHGAVGNSITQDQNYHEQSIHLPTTWICYNPLTDIPTAPMSDSGPTRFGCLNNPCKLSDPTLRLWARLLSAIPDSTLAIQSLCQEQRDKIAAIFHSNGISAARLHFVSRLNRDQYLRLYDQIDIALDPLPYNGITTTCDALWMGVPVITLPGRTAAGRAGQSILANVGLNELIAPGEDQFIEIARELANDRPRLKELRSTLRDRLRASPLMDFPQFARDMESALRQIWIGGIAQ